MQKCVNGGGGQRFREESRIRRWRREVIITTEQANNERKYEMRYGVGGTGNLGKFFKSEELKNYEELVITYQ